METTAARRPPANDEGVCGMFINLFRRQRPALARLARNSNAYRQPMVASVSSSAVGVSSITSASNTATAAGVSTLDATIGRIHDIPQSAMSSFTAVCDLLMNDVISDVILAHSCLISLIFGNR